MELTLEDKQALAAARARARKRAAEAQAEGRPWERDWSKPQTPETRPALKPWERDWSRPQPEPEELDLARARARARKRAHEEQSNGKPWEQFRDQSEARVQSEFEAQSWYGKAGRAAMDIARLGLDGASFGFGDKLLAGIEADHPGKRRSP